MGLTPLSSRIAVSGLAATRMAEVRYNRHPVLRGRGKRSKRAISCVRENQLLSTKSECGSETSELVLFESHDEQEAASACRGYLFALHWNVELCNSGCMLASNHHNIFPQANKVAGAASGIVSIAQSEQQRHKKHTSPNLKSRFLMHQLHFLHDQRLREVNFRWGGIQETKRPITSMSRRGDGQRAETRNVVPTPSADHLPGPS